ncbi:hypothetical protein MVES1_001007 [Malassezia vespertilionis]|uniref:uncharacterized protein n=1 Tax=Malassezia vespertilionis TaxID=2020962 RepID=UPI0024B05D19|nr:uncharacterized protein MVES1_001007 [Malassezia vespertilionis]WFD05675.1 hypothetical protein MVES1_001007 [Malassezia vespertilionis]
MSEGGADLPPTGGYAPIRYKRNLPARGPSGVTLIAGIIGITAFGFYRMGQGQIEKRYGDERRAHNSELARERAWSRIYLTPFLLAEADRDSFRREHAANLREEQVMKGVPGWEADKRVYNTKRYTPSNYVVM